MERPQFLIQKANKQTENLTNFPMNWKFIWNSKINERKSRKKLKIFPIQSVIYIQYSLYILYVVCELRWNETDPVYFYLAFSRFNNMNQNFKYLVMNKTGKMSKFLLFENRKILNENSTSEETI